MSGGQRNDVQLPVLGERHKQVHDVVDEGSGALRRAIRALLQSIAVSAQDSRELAAIVVLRMPPPMRAVPVHEFLCWTRGGDDRLVAKYMRAATITSEPKLGDLTGFQRAALVGALRLSRPL
jgi:hypothetical protein